MSEAEVKEAQAIAYYGTQYQAGIRERLDTSEFVESFRRQLMGIELQPGTDAEGNPTVVLSQADDPLMNRCGVRENVQFLESVAEKHSIMGNMDDEQYRDFVANNHSRYASLVEVNSRNRWGFTGDKKWLVGIMMNKIETVSSRTIDNLEREGLNVSVKQIERTEPEKEKKSFPYFGG